MIIKTYERLNKYINMFKKNGCDLLIIKSRGGLGKTASVRQIMKGVDYVYVNAQSTPLQTYKLLYERRDCQVIFDDIDVIFKSQIMVSLLKALTDSADVKEINYNTSKGNLGGIPRSFKTASKVCILLNEFNADNHNLAPLIDRCFFIQFEPTNKEIMEKLREIVKKSQPIETSKRAEKPELRHYKEKSQSLKVSRSCVFDFFDKNYQFIKDFSLRLWVKANQLYEDDKKTWKKEFMDMIGFDEKMIDYFKVIEEYDTEEERIENFKWSRATYFRIKQEVEE